MKKSPLTKVILLGSGMAFLASSVLGLSGLIGKSIDQPANSENAAQSQNAQLQAEERGFEGVLKREPKNQTALRGLVEIRMRRNDAAGTRTALEQLVKLNPANKQYQELLVLLDKQIADAKKVGTLKPSAPQQSVPSSK
jgi:cytochrome c-type biogenesis protein CcmH/NrfG